MSTFDPGKERKLPARPHDIPTPEALKKFMEQGWAPSPLDGLKKNPVASYTTARRKKLSESFPGKRLVIPAGTFKVRSNDSDYRFRPHTAYSWLTGINGTDAVPDSVLILEPNGSGHDSLLFIHPRSTRENSDEFYRNVRHGEFWVGRRMTLEETEFAYDIKVRHIDSLDDFLASAKDSLTVRGEDEYVDDRVKESSDDATFFSWLSEARLVKDEFEINEMQKAIDATHDSIVAAGSHACVLHWIRNDGELRDGELVLIDAGVEVESLYTADITRTLPINGKFTPAQRKIYSLVYAAQEAGMKAVKPGAKFRDFHFAASQVLARGLEEMGVLPIPAEESLKPDVGLHRRWTVHGTGHMLGMDVHDCAHARKEAHIEGVLQEGMILTVEPGLYIQPDDTLFPAEYRGIGVRIEDDVLVTKDGCKNLSAAMPRHPDEIEAWMESLLSK